MYLRYSSALDFIMMKCSPVLGREKKEIVLVLSKSLLPLWKHYLSSETRLKTMQGRVHKRSLRFVMT